MLVCWVLGYELGVRTDFLVTLCWSQFPHFLFEVRILADWSCFRLFEAPGSASRWQASAGVGCVLGRTCPQLSPQQLCHGVRSGSREKTHPGLGDL